MEAFALYLFKSVVWLTGFALVYLLFLRNERFFLLNRMYLVTGMVASILFPFFTWHYTIVIPFTPSVEVSDLQMTGIINEPEPFPTKEILLILYIAGSLYLLYRIIKQTITVLGVIRKSEILPYRSAKLIRSDAYPSSFSFFSFVFVNPSNSDTETSEIVNHEMEHVRQRHWIDLVLFELLCTLQWLNPLVWLYGRFIRQNHEFLADQHALQRTQNPAIYRAALINQLFGAEVISLANSFNYSINKKRFHMMTNTIQSPIRKLKLLVVLPLMAAVFYAFATPEYKYVEANATSTPHTGNIIPQQTEKITIQPEKITITQPKDKIISGKVLDDKGNPLPGTAVVIPSNNSGTITDNNGVFKLKITDASPIVVSHVGYSTQKLTPDAEKEMIINLKAVKVGLEEITITSLANQHSESYIDQVTVTALKKEISNNILGNTTKVQTSSPLKFVNADGSISQPLVVVDGVITDNVNANNIPPETIESIEVLKDASSIAMYGDKGKNGVIIIKRKKESSTSQNTPIDVNINQDANAQKGQDVYTIVEQMPEFPGKNAGLYRYLASQIKYPMSAKDLNIQGKVLVSFVVDYTGKVTNAKVVRGVDPSLDNEALRVVNGMPTWTPGKQGGKDVSVQYTMPINFVLEENKSEGNKPYTVVEQMPEFPGGQDAIRRFLATNIKYPVAAVENGIQGKVFVSFVVTKTGAVGDIKVVRGVETSLDKEAVRVVQLMPAWIPGKQNGEAVDVAYTIPVQFKLESAAKAENGQQSGKLLIVPNPTSNKAKVTLEGTDSTNKLQVSIIDSFGKVMKKEIKNGPSFQLSVSSLKPGNYVVVAIDGNKQYQGNLVVNH